MKKLLVLILATFLGCSWSTPIGDTIAWNWENILPTPDDSVCATIPEGESLLCQHLRRPETVDSILYIADAVFLQANPDKADKMINLINELEMILLQPNITYAALYLVVREMEGSLIGLAVASEINIFKQSESLIFDADKKMILYHLAKVRTLAVMAAGG
ncbi:MAG: hypothetical protein ACXAB9_15180 [Candidatus Thorarchaeota archaeon]|jgi:hypothetical protein